MRNSLDEGKAKQTSFKMLPQQSAYHTNIRPELRPPVPALKLSTVVLTCYPRIGEADTG